MSLFDTHVYRYCMPLQINSWIRLDSRVGREGGGDKWGREGEGDRESRKRGGGRDYRRRYGEERIGGI